MTQYEWKDKLLSDYKQASVTVIWCIHERVIKLIFSTIEFYPAEFILIPEVPEQQYKVKGTCIYYRRVAMTAEEALHLYQCG